MSVEPVRPGRREHRCNLPPTQGLWWAKVRCLECGSHWVSYGEDGWFPEGPFGALGRGMRGLIGHWYVWRLRRRYRRLFSTALIYRPPPPPAP